MQLNLNKSNVTGDEALKALNAELRTSMRRAAVEEDGERMISEAQPHLDRVAEAVKVLTDGQQGTFNVRVSSDVDVMGGRGIVIAIREVKDTAKAAEPERTVAPAAAAAVTAEVDAPQRRRAVTEADVARG